ncbi:MAG: type III pantothenate kinase [Ignavibacteria bacterium]|nr:type III pantothenate kinase [Ignavibacteria bacterium]
MLLVDIGNSRIKAAIAGLQGPGPVHIFSSASEAGDFAMASAIQKVVISSVRPGITEELSGILRNYLVDYLVITPNSPFSFSHRYSTWETIGVDRLCGLEGALHISPQAGSSPIITVDCGTATTINVLDSTRVFIGGNILPGLGTMAKSLLAGTAQLPEVEFAHVAELIGNSTSACIESGILFSTIALIEKVFHFLENKEHSVPEVIVTGGYGKLVAAHCPLPVKFSTDLVLRGLYRLSVKSN